MLGKLYSFASRPRAVDVKKKYRAPPDDDDFTPANLMHDPRVVRGNTYASLGPSREEQEAAALQKQREAQRRRLLRANQTKRRSGTPEAVPGRATSEAQTDAYLEELTEQTVEFEAETQTDPFLGRPPSPLFMPSKIGVDCETQIEDGELFNFDVECEPLLEVLVGKTLEQSMMEVLEEEELASLRRHQKEFEERRHAEMLEVQRIEAAELRRHNEMERRVQQQGAQRELDLSSMRKVVSRSIASAHLSSLKERALAHLLDAGVFADSVQLGVESSFMPGLLNMVSQQMRQDATHAQLFDGVVKHTVASSLANHERLLEFERRRLHELEKVERELRKETEDLNRKKEENENRIRREQCKMTKFDALVPPRPKITDFVIVSFDGESVLLDDGRRVTEFGDDSLKEELQAMMAGLTGESGETVVCNIATDPDFVPPEGADPNIAWGSKLISLRKFRVNSFYLEVIEAKGLRDYPCDPYVVVMDVDGLVGDEKRTEVCPQTLAPEWNHKFNLPVTFKLAAMEFEVRDANPDHKNADGEDDLLLSCRLPVDMLYDAIAKTPPGEEVELDAWLETKKHLKEPDASTSQGQLHVHVRAKFNIPIMIPGTEIDLPSQFQLGLAWEFIHQDKPVDLDASVVGLNTKEKIVDQVWYQKLEGFGGAVSHSGDDTTGEGDGDDETITIDLDRIPDSVEKLVVCINAYEEQPLDTCVSFSYLRLIVGDTSHGFFSMGEGWIPKCTGIFFGVVMRRDSGWKFVSTAVAADGSTVHDSMPAILAYGKKHLGW
mmetsp:Transcript_110196/g.322480  ORF Transcript_110196/g.322480 Transcript_110196/m.322480 type:complete len:778 (+) Transcript_110196:61-2394(+)